MFCSKYAVLVIWKLAEYAAVNLSSLFDKTASMLTQVENVDASTIINVFLIGKLFLIRCRSIAWFPFFLKLSWSLAWLHAFSYFKNLFFFNKFPPQLHLYHKCRLDNSSLSADLIKFKIVQTLLRFAKCQCPSIATLRSRRTGSKYLSPSLRILSFR